MSEILEFNRTARIRQQASVWLARMQETMSSEQQQELVAWLEIDDAHGEHLLELATVWDEFEVLTELAALFEGLSISPSKTLGAKQTVFASFGRHAASVLPRIGLAACLFLAIGVYWMHETPSFEWFKQISKKTEPSSLEQKPAESTKEMVEVHKAAVGEHRVVSLNDGSVVTLNTGTLIKVSFSESQRTIHLLNGEAHFDVANDPQRPLKVMVSGKAVEAIGTAFSVRKKSETNVEVAVDEGLVAVYQLKSLSSEFTKPLLKASLDAGDVLTIDERGVELSEYDIDEMEDRLAWRNGMIVINDETLNHVIDEFSRYSEQKILLADRAMGEIRVAGYFNLGDMDALLVALERNFKIRSEYYQSNNTFVLSQLSVPQQEVR